MCWKRQCACVRCVCWIGPGRSCKRPACMRSWPAGPAADHSCAPAWRCRRLLSRQPAPKPALLTASPFRSRLSGLWSSLTMRFFTVLPRIRQMGCDSWPSGVELHCTTWLRAAQRLLDRETAGTTDALDAISVHHETGLDRNRNAAGSACANSVNQQAAGPCAGASIHPVADRESCALSCPCRQAPPAGEPAFCSAVRTDN